ncbi:hypothetical protein PENANT_c001G05185 [Penicillium antarcticum]|uniref:Dihydrofolate reductase n=1 Tax=Penicillium antarcticum TaxID=416450 RepID=A0A1V6QN92_9EURO|nr:uncharacterized protein N7508_010190 [Penicillium antarcticum]KAJ5295369.1 hypothetical protein N7508_010190 [Penicillium antarcticum]OQD90709.1 hypothetical protein PENANT_c001G05185 [Penicillium antarcticum]
MPHPNPLTLIVATTPPPLRHATEETTTRLGIGLKGTLPWPRIKTDMTFFARVTSRPPTSGQTNAIIMGRKTYDSVPVNLRPLAKRISVVVTRDMTGSVKKGVLGELVGRRQRMAKKSAEAAAAKKDGDENVEKKVEPVTDAIVVPSLEQALERLDVEYGEKGILGKVFVIGGAEIYNAAIRLQGGGGLGGRALRVVMTNVVRKGVDGGDGSFECDTFFPVDRLDEGSGWRAASSAEVSEWVGEEVDGLWKSEGDVEVQMVGFEKV